MFYVLAGFSCSCHWYERRTLYNHASQTCCEFKGVSKNKCMFCISRIQGSIIFFIQKKYIRHAFQVFRKSSPVGLTMLQGTFYVHQGTHSYRPKIPLTSWILPVGFIIFTQVCFARVLKPARFQNVLFSKRVLNSEHLEWKTAEEISTEI